ncbi:hypothetical protein [Streptomyces violens]|uniref:hypothetical protein n=1 Tax=Streptomyces violens TaxID=66377 RepID=UPI000A66E0E0|nr:hypothetical protein [Streptomyces violens]
MEILVLIAAIILATGIGMRVIHLLNAQHDARIASYRFSDPLPRPPGQTAGEAPQPPRRLLVHSEGNTPA